MPKVLNAKEVGQFLPNAVYIGRPSKWGNPFVIGRDGSREEVIEKYEEHLERTYLLLPLWELKDKDLICWCAPLLCHGDILLSVVKNYYEME